MKSLIRIVEFFIVLSLSCQLFASPPSWVEPFKHRTGGFVELGPQSWWGGRTLKNEGMHGAFRNDFLSYLGL